MLGVAMQENLQMPEEAKAIGKAIPLVLRRMVRLIIGTIPFPAIAEILKSIYVEEAQKKLIQDGTNPTKSALALLTGLDTRVVSTIQDAEFNIHIDPQKICPEAALLETWAKDSFFQDEITKKPAILPLEGRGRSFHSLVLKSVGRNITVKTVLNKLVESGNVRSVSGNIDRVELLSVFYSPISSDRAIHTDIAFLEASRVLNAVIHNMNSAPEERVPQQGRWTYRLNPENYKKFRIKARKLMEKQIKEGEVLLEEFEEPKKHPGQITVGFGWYQWSDHEPEEEGE